MKISTFAAAFALTAGFACNATAPARAEGTMPDGLYLYHDEDGDTGKWTIRTTCTPDCVAHVTTTSGRGFDAPLVDGRYTNTREIHDGVVCPGYTAGDYGRWIPASEHPVTVFQWWDAQTLAGEVDYIEHNAPCNISDRIERFTLHKIG